MAIIQNDPVYAIPSNANMYGLNLSTTSTSTAGTNITGSNALWAVAAGQCRDSTDSFDIMVGAANTAGIPPQLNGPNTSAPLTGSLAVSGVNGLDTGTVAASTPYYVYLIADSRYIKPTATIASLSTTAPLLPFGYDSYRMIGWIRTSSTSFVLPFTVSGSNEHKWFTLEAPIALTTITTAATATVIACTNAMPYVNYGKVAFRASFTVATTADSYQLRQGGNLNTTAGAGFTLVNQVITIPAITQVTLQPATVAGVPGLNGSGTASNTLILQVGSFEMCL